MAQLHRLEGNDPRIAGILVIFEGNQALEITWSARAPIKDTRREAQSYAAALVDTLKAGQMWHHVDGANWVSMVAAIKKHLDDFNARLMQAIRPPDSGTNVVPLDLT